MRPVAAWREADEHVERQPMERQTRVDEGGAGDGERRR